MLVLELVDWLLFYGLVATKVVGFVRWLEGFCMLVFGAAYI